MNVLFLDYETNSSDAKTTHATEVGAVMYQVEDNTFIELARQSCLIYDPDYPPQPEKIIEITGITDEMLQTEGNLGPVVFQGTLELVDQADIVMAHKTSFDKTVFLSGLKKYGLKEPQKKEWICTLTNFPWKPGLTCHKLGHLAWEHDIPVKASELHRAINDVEVLAKLVKLYDFDKVLEYSRIPWTYYWADVLGPWQDGGVQNQIAKELGFAWEQVKGVDEYKWTKKWVTRVKKGNEKKLLEAVAQSKSPFRVTEILGLQ